MSHFIGLVFVNTGNDCLDDILAPYDEQTEDSSYLEFEDCTDEVKTKWERRHEELTEKELAEYPTIRDFAKYYFCYEVDCDENGNAIFGYESNPNAKWDWWTIGGRWSNFIVGKDGQRHDELWFDEVDWDAMCDNSDNIPFCFVKRYGEWQERAEMGWWGMTSNEKEESAWTHTFKDYVDNLRNQDEDQLLQLRVYAVDFHI